MGRWYNDGGAIYTHDTRTNDPIWRYRILVLEQEERNLTRIARALCNCFSLSLSLWRTRGINVA